MMKSLFFLLAIVACVSQAFVVIPQHQHSSPSSLCSVIKSEEVDFAFDVGQGGVRLAETTAIQLAGNVQHKPGSATASLAELTRFNKLTEVSSFETVQAALQAVGARIVCTGVGKEDYRDPGETTATDKILAPFDAVRDALTGAGTGMDASKLAINFCGGDELQVLEVMEAAQQMVLMLDIPTKCRVSFHSISDASFPATSASVTVIDFPETEASSIGGLKGAEKAIASGLLYSWNDKYYTVLEEDINDDVA